VKASQARSTDRFPCTHRNMVLAHTTRGVMAAIEHAQAMVVSMVS